MKDQFKKYFFYSELSGLYIVVFSLPTMESVKWMGLALLLGGTLGRMVMQGRIVWRKPGMFEWVLVALLLTACLSTLANWPLPNNISGLKNTSLYLLLGWLMYVNRYTDSQIMYFVLAAVGGVLFGLTWSAVDLFSGQNYHLEFNSMPNLNRSVIYHLMAIFTMCAVLLDNGTTFPVWSRIGVGISLVISLIGLIVMGSRAGIIAFLSGVGLLFIMFLGNRRVRIALLVGMVAIVMAVTVMVVFVDHPRVKYKLDRFKHYYEMVKGGSGAGLSLVVATSNRTRYDYIRVAWAQITQKGGMLLGSGPRTFKYIKVEELEFDEPLMEYKKGWDRPSHAHNEYLTRWVEQGILGLAAHIFLLVYMGVRLFQNRSRSGRIDWQWVACLGVFNTAVVAGLFNTVLTNEAAWLAMMLTGVFMQRAGRPTEEHN